MTLVAAWVRSFRDVKELVVASDSRLGAGYRWDGCPKVFPLARSDSLIAFAGSTEWSYPLMLQLDSAISIFARSRDRALGLEEMKTYALKVFNDMHGEFRRPVLPSLRAPDVEFVLGGWSWVRGEFSLWHCAFSERHQSFLATRARTWGGAPLLFAGSAAREAYSLLRKMLRQRRLLRHDGLRLNYEPFEVLRDMLRAAGPDSDIGGAPQVFKVYQHMNVRGLGVWWPDKARGRVAYAGRILRPYEKGDSVSILDPDALKTDAWPRFSQEEDRLVWRRRLIQVLAKHAERMAATAPTHYVGGGTGGL